MALPVWRLAVGLLAVAVAVASSARAGSSTVAPPLDGVLRTGGSLQINAAFQTTQHFGIDFPLSPSSCYEVKVSHLAIIPASFVIRWATSSPSSAPTPSPPFALLNTEKLAFCTDYRGLLPADGGFTVSPLLVSVTPYASGVAPALSASTSSQLPSHLPHRFVPYFIGLEVVYLHVLPAGAVRLAALLLLSLAGAGLLVVRWKCWL
eukprot:gnl/Hemi2/9144_TR3178_c0_g1_i1.p1 gnl/Hemi2/9144_TR3178_c0_g1~~gnl/Hemi2/9144_TR3178_c0_g1_i1.p1  ORF type:complete len:226 (-),score=24.82 gnl/Hemi2/9144_TR3178_c0_g1_i1:146-763(-)